MIPAGLHGRWRIWAATAWLLSVATARCAEPVDPAQPTPAAPAAPVSSGPPEAPSLRYRRVHAPLDAIAQWPHGPERYVPVEKERFDRWVAAAEQRQVGPPGISTPAAVAAEYAARLDGDTLVSGTATLEVRNQSGRSLPLTLEPMAMALAEPQWEGSPPRPASLGVGEDGRVSVRVDASGRLRWKWSLRGTRDADGTLVVPLQLPPCSSNRLSIELPAESTLSAESAIVSASDAAAGTRRWLVELGGRNRSVLRMTADGASRFGQPGARARSTLTCELSPSGIDLIGLLTIDSPQSPLREIALDADPSLELISVRQGEASLSWTVQASGGRAGQKRYVVAMSEAIRGYGRSLRFQAVAPLAVGRRQPVPLLRVEPSLWQEATLTLVVPSPLKLEDVRIVKGRQTGWTPLAEPRSGETAEFQLFGPDAAVELTAALATSQLAIDSGTTLQMRGLELAAQATASVRAAADQHFRLEADVSPRWSIDAVESTPPDALADWTIRPVPDGTRSGPDARPDKGSGFGGRLVIRLARSVGPSRTIRVRVSARYSLPPIGQSLTHDDWDPIRFVAPAGGRRWIAVDVAEDYRVQLVGDERLSRIDPATLAANFAELLPSSPRGLVFEVDRAGSPLQIVFQIQKPQYAAALRVEAAAESSMLRESFLVRCEPQTGRVDRVVLDVKPPPARPLLWSLEDEDDQQLAARIVSPTNPGSAAAGAQTWEITLRRPRSAPFALRASQSRPFTQRTSVTLLAAPEATSQRGTIAVLATETPPRIEAARLSPAAVEPFAAERRRFVRASFRYDPVQEMTNATRPMDLVPSPTEPPLPSAWIWSAQYESRFEPGGTARHAIALRLQSGGRRRLCVTLPPGYAHDDVVGVWIDYVKTTWSPRTASSQQRRSGDEGAPAAADLELPGGREFSLIVIQLIRNDAPLGLFATVEPPRIQTDVPVLAHRWTAWLPSSYASPAGMKAMADDDSPAYERLRRVVGPLARRPRQPRFDPFSPEAWLSLGHSANPRTSDRDRVAQWLSDLRTAPAAPAGNAAPSRAERSTPAAVTWSDYLSVAAERWPGTLRIDRDALAEADISAKTAMASGLSMGSASPAALWQQAEVAVLLVGDTAIVTTAAEVGLQQSELESVAGDVVWRVRSGPAASRLAEAVADRSNPRYLSADAWRKIPPEPRSPWSATDASSRATLDSVGWTAYQTTAWSDPPPSISVYRRDMAACLGWAAWSAGLAVVLWGSRRWPRRVAVAIGLAAASSLLADGVLATAARGLFLGGLSGWVCLVLGGRFRAAASAGLSASAAPGALSGSVLRAAAPLMLAIVCGWIDAVRHDLGIGSWIGAGAYGQEPGEPTPVRMSAGKAPESTAGPLPQVFVPTDDQQRPVGSRYYVPDDFLRRLERAASDEPVAPGRWRILAAEYRGSVQWHSSAEQLDAAPLHASFDVETLARNARIRIPAGAKGLGIVAESVVLDGRAVHPAAVEGSEAIELPVLDPGRYRLEMELRPVADARGEQHAFEWKLPRAPRARLELSLPADAPAPQLGGALGSVTREVQPSRLIADLGPTDRLSIAWRAGGMRSNRVAVDAEEYLWLKVKPGSVVLEVLLKCRPTEGRVHSVDIESDPRLRPVAAQAGKAVAPQMVAGDGDLQRWRVALPQPADGDFSVPMQFVWTENAGVGTLRPPAFRLIDARTTKRWLAVSVDRDLHAETADGDRSAMVAPSAFLAAWGSEASPPALAVALSSLKSEWRVAIQPTTPHTAVRQTTSFSLAEGNAEVLIEASLTTTGGAVFQHRVQVPPEIEIGRVTLTTQELERVARWSRTPDGMLTIFSSAPLSAKQQLQVWGRMAIPRRGTFPLPSLRVVGDDAASHVRILRQPMVRAEVVRAPETAAAEPAVADVSRLPGRSIAAYRESSGRPPVEVRVEPNRPKLRADQTVILRCADASWEVEIAMQMHVTEGVVDQFHIEIPAAVVGPFKTEPAGLIEVSEPDGKGIRLATFRPATSVSGDCALRIVGALRAPKGEPTSAPRVRLVGAEVGRNMVVLPVQQEVQPLWWDTRGLLGTDLPEAIGIPPASRRAWAAYLVLREPWQARLRIDGRSGAGPHVALADIHAWVGADGNCAAVARFDVEPFGSPECRIEIPPSCRILSIVVDGYRVAPEENDEKFWPISLSATGLPQRIEILFSQPLARTSQPAALASPWLVDLPVRQTSWTVQGVHVVGGSPDASLEETRPDDQELCRLRSIASLMETVSREPPADRDALLTWHRQWSRHWIAARNRLLRRPLNADERSGDSGMTEVTSLQRRVLAVAEQIGKPDEASSPASEPASGEDMLALWSAIAGSGHPAEHWTAAGGAKTIDVVGSAPTTGVGWHDGMTALAFFGAWIAAVWAVGRSSLLQRAGRWPAAVLLGLAVVWWAWLQPSVLGLVLGSVAAVALAFSIAAARRRARRLPSIALAKTQFPEAS